MSRWGLDFVTVDVFTETTFGGNPLAVFFATQRLSAGQMQQIAREINYSETAFVLPPANPANSASIRIFTPVYELPFAGHPNVGCGFVLANHPAAIPTSGMVKTQTNSETGQKQMLMRFEEKAGLVEVAVDLEADDKAQRATIAAPQKFQQRSGHSGLEITRALNLGVNSLRNKNSPVPIVSIGIEFPVVEVCALEDLQHCSANHGEFMRLSLDLEPIPDSSVGIDLSRAFLVYVYCRTGANTVSARMFDPLHGIPEDPATGSAAGALAGLLATQDGVEGNVRYEIAQGHEMGRPSSITVDVARDKGQIRQTRISGRCVEVIEGQFSLPNV